MFSNQFTEAPRGNDMIKHPMHRREFLVASGLGLAGATSGLVSLGAPATVETSPVGRATAKSTILIWLNGGPSHIDLWDMKPDAPREIRGDF